MSEIDASKYLASKSDTGDSDSTCSKSVSKKLISNHSGSYMMAQHVTLISNNSTNGFTTMG